MSKLLNEHQLGKYAYMQHMNWLASTIWAGVLYIENYDAHDAKNDNNTA